MSVPALCGGRVPACGQQTASGARGGGKVEGVWKRRAARVRRPSSAPPPPAPSAWPCCGCRPGAAGGTTFFVWGGGRRTRWWRGGLTWAAPGHPTRRWRVARPAGRRAPPPRASARRRRRCRSGRAVPARRVVWPPPLGLWWAPAESMARPAPTPRGHTVPAVPQPPPLPLPPWVPTTRGAPAGCGVGRWRSRRLPCHDACWPAVSPRVVVAGWRPCAVRGGCGMGRRLRGRGAPTAFPPTPLPAVLRRPSPCPCSSCGCTATLHSGPPRHACPRRGWEPTARGGGDGGRGKGSKRGAARWVGDPAAPPLPQPRGVRSAVERPPLRSTAPLSSLPSPPPAFLVRFFPPRLLPYPTVHL